VGAAQQPISAPLLVAAILGVAAAVGLWWLYFDMVSLAAEQRLLEAHGQARVDLAVGAYTYRHFPIVAGIVLTALGIEGVLAHADDSKPLGGFYALPLFGGIALYLAGQLLFKRRMHRTLSLPRLVATGVLLAALIGVETTRYAQARRDLRGAWRRSISSPPSSRVRRSLPRRRRSTPSARRTSATWRLRRGSPRR
jgi:low temperature requirement protein LtrA